MGKGCLCTEVNTKYCDMCYDVMCSTWVGEMVEEKSGVNECM